MKRAIRTSQFDRDQGRRRVATIQFKQRVWGAVEIETEKFNSEYTGLKRFELRGPSDQTGFRLDNDATKLAVRAAWHDNGRIEFDNGEGGIEVHNYTYDRAAEQIRFEGISDRDVAKHIVEAMKTMEGMPRY